MKNRDIFTNSQITAKFLQFTMRRLTERIPDELMHRLWRTGEKQQFLDVIPARQRPKQPKF